MLRQQFRHTVRGNTSLDYVTGDAERALRSGVWVPETRDKILAAIDHLRHVVTQPNCPAETIAVAGIRVGRLITEAKAKDHWPIVAEGRQHRVYRAKQSERSIAGNIIKREEAAPRKARLAADVRAYRAKHPTHSHRAIARNLIGKHSARSVEALAKQIARLSPKAK